MAPNGRYVSRDDYAKLLELRLQELNEFAEDKNAVGKFVKYAESLQKGKNRTLLV